MRDDVERLQRIGRLRGERRVAADVIGMDVRVDDEADRPVRQLADLGEQLRRRRRKTGVDDEDAVVADLHGDVAAGAGQHVDVPLHRQHFDRGATRPAAARGCGCCAANQTVDTPTRRQPIDDDGFGLRGASRMPYRRLQPPPSRPQLQYRSHRAGGGFAGLPMRFRYSGYIVSAPPRVASAGRPYQSATSWRNGFVPGR